jgi:hypothetical protein
LERGLASCISDERDIDHNDKYEREIGERAMKGFELFGKYFYLTTPLPLSRYSFILPFLRQVLLPWSQAFYY